jgi:hypothetical protein
MLQLPVNVIADVTSTIMGDTYDELATPRIVAVGIAEPSVYVPLPEMSNEPKLTNLPRM